MREIPAPAKTIPKLVSNDKESILKSQSCKAFTNVAKIQLPRKIIC